MLCHVVFMLQNTYITMTFRNPLYVKPASALRKLVFRVFQCQYLLLSERAASHTGLQMCADAIASPTEFGDGASHSEIAAPGNPQKL